METITYRNNRERNIKQCSFTGMSHRVIPADRLIPVKVDSVLKQTMASHSYPAQNRVAEKRFARQRRCRQEHDT